MMIDFLNRKDINWAAIAALSNIAVAIVTLMTVIVTLYFSWNNVRTKTKIVIQRIERGPKISFYKILLINNGFIPINITQKGIIIYKPFWKKKKKIFIFNKIISNKKIELAERETIIDNFDDVNDQLITYGYKPGDKVKLVAFFIDPGRKIFYKKFNVNVYDKNDQQSSLNMEIIRNISTD